MLITFTIPDEQAAEVKARLDEEARACGLTLDSYLVQKLVGSPVFESERRKSVAEAVDSIRELRRGNRLDGLTIKDLVNEGRRY